jgi:hypothetical protein
VLYIIIYKHRHLEPSQYVKKGKKLSVQDIHDHLAKYTTIPEGWRSKNYAFKFVECINCHRKTAYG